MIAPDTGVLGAGFATWHEGHASAVRTLDRGVHLIAHTALETYSVLARLPAPHRVEAVIGLKLSSVEAFIVSAYRAGITSGDYLTLDSESRRGLIDHLAARGVTGGATYAALIGWTAKLAGATVLTRDVLRVAFELVA